MRYLWFHLEQILAQYQGAVPLHHFLKNYFKGYPKLGSRDRRGLSDASYAWYRVGHALKPLEKETQELRLAALFLCGLKPRAIEASFPVDWDIADSDYRMRIRFLESQGFVVNLQAIFQYPISFSDGISADVWRQSMLRQPRLFLRIRRQHFKIEALLKDATIGFEWISSDCLALPNGCSVEKFLQQNTYVIQDASSQETGLYFTTQSTGEAWWDCCSGAGGKSLMLVDKFPGVRLLATDVRQNILQNLKERFELYGIKSPECKVLDCTDPLAMAHFMKGRQRFDGIICDVPCSGSGTWARTPENCFFFHLEQLKDYSDRQARILSNAAQYLKPSGSIYYITCSVFEAENEQVIHTVLEEGKLQLISMNLMNGIDNGADSLFLAVLKLN